SLPPKSAAVSVRAWIWVPMAPSKTSTRSRSVSRKRLVKLGKVHLRWGSSRLERGRGPPVIGRRHRRSATHSRYRSPALDGNSGPARAGPMPHRLDAGAAPSQRAAMPVRLDLLRHAEALPADARGDPARELTPA